MKVRVTPVEGGGFVELPREWLERRSLKVGDELEVVELPDGIKLVGGKKDNQPPSQ